MPQTAARKTATPKKAGEPDKKIMFTTIQGVREPRQVDDREVRPIPCLPGYGITRTGLIRGEDAGETWTAENWPYSAVPDDHGAIFSIHVLAAAALAWLSPDQRQDIRRRLPEGGCEARDKAPEILALAGEFGVGAKVLVYLAGRADDALCAWTQDQAPAAGGDLLHFGPGVMVDEYHTFPHEKYRPPSQGGMTSALHVHRLTINGEAFTFLARGTKKWVFATDTVRFSYRVTPEGYRNVVRSSIQTWDKSGKPVVRGDRRLKPVLRTAEARLPASRREQRFADRG